MPGTTEAIAFPDSYKHMECLGGMRLQSLLTDLWLLCLPVQRRVPQLVLIKTGDCLLVCLFVCLFICSAMGGQTARPNGLKFGG